MIEEVKEPAGFMAFDFLVLVALHSVFSKKAIEAVFRSKILAMCLTAALLDAVFKSQRSVSDICLLFRLAVDSFYYF